MNRTAALLIALCLLSSCEFFRTKQFDPENYPSNPWQDIRTVLVLPFLNLSSEKADADHLGNICASELVKFPGFRVLRPIHARMQLGPEGTIDSVETALEVARKMKADAVLIVALTDYDPYNPPKMGVTVMMLRTSARNLHADDIDKITRSAEWRSAPMPLSRRHAGNFVAAFDRVYDSAAITLQYRIEDYMGAQQREDRGFKDIREYLMVTDRFVQFVSCQFLSEIIAQ